MSVLRQQPDGIERRPLLVSALVVVLAIVASALTVWLITLHYRGTVVAWPGAAQRFLGTPEDVSALELHPFSERTAAERQRDSAMKQLAGYGWVDRERGLLRVPIDVAARLYLRAESERGAP